MRFHIFLSGAAVLATGGIALRVLDEKQAMDFLLGTLTLGGGMIICGLFSLKMKWHGIVGAGVLALLGAARGVANFPDFVTQLSGEHSRGPAPTLELGVTLICLALLLQVLRTLQRERIRRLLEEE
jgi:hypothetical protein